MQFPIIATIALVLTAAILAFILGYVLGWNVGCDKIREDARTGIVRDFRAAAATINNQNEAIVSATWREVPPSLDEYKDGEEPPLPHVVHGGDDSTAKRYLALAEMYEDHYKRDY